MQALQVRPVKVVRLGGGAVVSGSRSPEEEASSARVAESGELEEVRVLRLSVLALVGSATVEPYSGVISKVVCYGLIGVVRYDEAESRFGLYFR
ncbi:hypothetical protein SRHO_G00165670 [Serrasalmus rhombeus]